MDSRNAIVVAATPFREVPDTRGRRMGFGDALASADDGLTQLAPLQKLIDDSQGVEGVPLESTQDAQAAMLALTSDLNAIKAAGPTDVFAAPAKFNGPSFLMGLGVALAASAVVYLTIVENAPKRRPARRRTA